MAGNSPNSSPSSRRGRKRRRLLLILAPLLLVAGAWKIAEHYIDIERYRATIDTELEQLLRLPLEFEDMDLRVLPSPRLVVENVALGEGDFLARAPSVAVTASLRALLQGRLELHAVTLRDLEVRLPEDSAEFLGRWSEYLATLQTPRPSREGGGGKVTLETIHARDATVYRGESAWVAGELQVAKVTGGSPLFTFEGRADSIPGAPEARGEFTISARGNRSVYGNATVAGLPLEQLTGDPALPPFTLDTGITFSQSREGALDVEAEGTLALSGEPELLGSFAITARRDGGDLRFSRFQIDTDPLAANASLHLAAGGGWSLEIMDGEIRDTGIGWLTARLPAIPFRDNPGVRSRGVLTGVHMGDQGAGFVMPEGAIRVEGVDLQAGAGMVLPSLNGSATIAGGRITVLEAASAQVSASGTVDIDYAADVITVDLSGQVRLDPALALPDALAGSWRAESGVVGVEAIRATITEGVWDLATLELDTVIDQAVIAAWDEAAGAWAPAPAISGSISAAEGTLRLGDIEGAGSVLNAELTPDAEPGRWSFAGELASDLASPIWKPLYPQDRITITRGEIETAALTGTIAGSPPALASLRVEARARQVEARVHAPGYEDTVTVADATLSLSETRLSARGAGASGRFGPFEADGNAARASGVVEGRVTLQPAQAPAWRGGPADALLPYLTPLPLDIRYTPENKRLTFESTEPFRLEGEAAAPPEGAARAPVSVAARAAIPASWLAPEVFEAAGGGDLEVTLTLDPQSGKLIARADGAASEFARSVFRKKAGYPAAVELEGTWGSGNPRFTHGRAELGAASAPFELREDGLASDNFSIDLAALDPLMPGDATISGTVQGHIAQNFGAMDLSLRDARATLGDDATRVVLNGALRRRTAGWDAPAMEWAAGESRGRAAIERSGADLHGEIRAERIDIDGLVAAYRAWNPLRSADAPPPTAGDRSFGRSFTGAIQIQSSQLDWVDASLLDARALLAGGPEAIELRGVTFRHGGGTGTGALVYTRDTGAASVTLDLSEVDATLLEGLFLANDRGLQGRLSGSASLTFPFAATGREILHGLSGRIAFDARDGTLGKAGLASKLITALRTTDVLRLRVPQLRDRGLTFTELTGEINIAQGVFHLAPYAMADTTYILKADATFDFPGDRADGQVEVQVLEGVTGVARRIPLLGDAANMVNKVFSAPLRITGPATDPVFRVGVPGV